MDRLMLESVIKICLKAGKIIMQFYHGREFCSMGYKNDSSPVTSADIVANRCIVSDLQKLTPEIQILSEEGISLWSGNDVMDYFWVVDPLDGTKEFLSHNNEFTVNVALVEKDIPVMGVIYAPALGVIYAGIYNQVWKIDVKTQYRVIVSPRKFYPPVIVISRFHNDYKSLKNYLTHFVNYRIITVGSSLKFCLLAEGVAQIYPRFSYTNIWDIAAGHAIVLSAGCVVNSWDGAALQYTDIKFSFLNSGFHAFVW